MTDGDAYRVRGEKPRCAGDEDRHRVADAAAGRRRVRGESQSGQLSLVSELGEREREKDGESRSASAKRPALLFFGKERRVGKSEESDSGDDLYDRRVYRSPYEIPRGDRRGVQHDDG